MITHTQIVIVLILLSFSSCKHEVDIDKKQILENGISLDTSFLKSANEKELYDISSKIYSTIIDPRTSFDTTSIITGLHYAIRSYELKNSNSKIILISHLYASLSQWDKALDYLQLANFEKGNNYLINLYKGAVYYKTGETIKADSVLERSYNVLKIKDNYTNDQLVHMFVLDILINGENVALKHKSGQPNFKNNYFINEFQNNFLPNFSFEKYIDRKLFVKAIRLKPSDFYLAE